MKKIYCWLSSDNSGSSWAATVASYCPDSMAEHTKLKSTEGFQNSSVSPCRSSGLSSSTWCWRPWPPWGSWTRSSWPAPCTPSSSSPGGERCRSRSPWKEQNQCEMTRPCELSSGKKEIRIFTHPLSWTTCWLAKIKLIVFVPHSTLQHQQSSAKQQQQP